MINFIDNYLPIIIYLIIMLIIILILILVMMNTSERHILTNYNQFSKLLFKYNKELLKQKIITIISILNKLNLIIIGFTLTILLCIGIYFQFLNFELPLDKVQ